MEAQYISMPFSPSEIEAAYAHCASVARRHYENFPVASLLIPKQQRRHVAAIYAFARQADDFADEASYEGRRVELLAEWRRKLNDAARGVADDPVFIALSSTIASERLPVGLLHDLISAFEQDTRVSHYETFAELADYCRLSANPVGRLVLHLFGRTDDHLLVQSDAICTGLQLANFWQDVAIDQAKGRCYIPREDLARFRCTTAELADGRPGHGFIDVMRFEVNRTRGLFRQGSGLPRAVGGRLGFELKLVLLGGIRILERIERSNYDVFRHRPALGAPDWALLLMRAARATSP